VSTQNYHDAFVNYDFGIYFRNSLIVTLVTTFLVLTVGTMAGYALGRLPMRGKFTLMVTLLINKMAVLNQTTGGIGVRCQSTPRPLRTM